MVLDEASAQQDAFADNSPSSDADPYSSSRNSSGPIPPMPTSLPPYIDLNQFARPAPLSGFFEGWTEDYLKAGILQRARRASAAMQRPVQKPEWEAFTQTQATLHSICSYALPVSAAAAATRSEQPSVRSKFKFPFWTPKPDKFNPLKFGPIEGQWATYFWHMARRSAYFTLCLGIGKLAFAGYAMAKVQMRERADPRLMEYKRTLLAMGQAETQKRRQQRGTMAGASSEQSRTQQTPPTQPVRPRQGPPVAPPRNVFDMDDASPTAGNESADVGMPSESAWDRVRSGRDRSVPREPQQSRSQNGPNVWAQRRRQDRAQGAASRGDSFSFAESDGDKQLAQDEAQKDFDARIERERRGKDFEDSQRGWRR